ncbi:uncharacterized protein N7477_000644 [Penicillium maclennaniae]|uniref:uncharacterized protein n=1 Tax=Penicillium maclennaniae TaxID=1343394 RepID=UPI002540E7B8|nr:uncharacterized protein N7477_000644 [Penicillium maclennaniae]KAJ5684299.1 hypothetical protein N7477_000644 [Penicillium maclennaniae]
MDAAAVDCVTLPEAEALSKSRKFKYISQRSSNDLAPEVHATDGEDALRGKLMLMLMRFLLPKAALAQGYLDATFRSPALDPWRSTITLKSSHNCTILIKAPPWTPSHTEYSRPLKTARQFVLARTLDH